MSFIKNVKRIQQIYSDPTLTTAEKVAMVKVEGLDKGSNPVKKIGKWVSTTADKLGDTKVGQFIKKNKNQLIAGGTTLVAGPLAGIAAGKIATGYDLAKGNITNSDVGFNTGIGFDSLTKPAGIDLTGLSWKSITKEASEAIKKNGLEFLKKAKDPVQVYQFAKDLKTLKNQLLNSPSEADKMAFTDIAETLRYAEQRLDGAPAADGSTLNTKITGAGLIAPVAIAGGVALIGSTLFRKSKPKYRY